MSVMRHTSDDQTDQAYDHVANMSEATYYRALTARSPKDLRRMFGRMFPRADWVDIYDRLFDEDWS